jgi:uncharacterized protein YllA (UPF0747 family)
MSLSIVRRRDACLRLLRSDFDIDATTKWVVKEYADDPSMQRATNKDRLARNIITIGGSGDQQQLNMVAFQQALAQHAEEQRRKAVNTEAAKAAEFAAQLDKARTQIHEMEREYREQVKKVQSLQGQLSTAKEESLQKALTEIASG